ncbi:MAG: phage portal protein [Chloroflexi bacterium]|nr:phage portal protein [Chloroflexota bacterium]
MGILNNISEGLAQRVRERSRRASGTVQKRNRISRVLVDSIDLMFGRGAMQADERSFEFGDYFSNTGAIHASIKLRSSAISSVPLVVEQRIQGIWERAEPTHGLVQLLRRPNPHWTLAELLRATETYVLIWGASYWGIERSVSNGAIELWPLRPDRVRVLPDKRQYLRGFLYENVQTTDGDVAYLPDEMVWFKHFNPKDEFTGASSISPVKDVADMAGNAHSFNRNFFSNSATPGDLAITTDETPDDDTANDFLNRWEDRFKGERNAHRPVLLGAGMDIKRTGLSHRDMEFISTLKWSVEEVARVFGVPKAFLADLTEATFANINAEERFFWRNTIIPELTLFADELNRSLVPLFGSSETLRVSFDVSTIDALKESETQRVERVVSLVNAGILTVDEARAGEGLKPL